MQNTSRNDPARRIPVDQFAASRLSESFAALGPHASRLAPLMYTKLFARYPALRRLFPSDMASQERKLLDSLLMVVDHMREPARVREYLVGLGRRHLSYGAAPEHYPIVCRLLVEAIAETSTSNALPWDAALESEWTQALQIVSDIMISAGQGPATHH